MVFEDWTIMDRNTAGEAEGPPRSETHAEQGKSTVSPAMAGESVRPQSMRITVASLEAMGAISGEPDPTDGRQSLIDLTPSFRKTLKESRAAKDDWLVRALKAQLSPQEQEALAAAVKLLQRLADF